MSRVRAIEVVEPVAEGADGADDERRGHEELRDARGGVEREGDAGALGERDNTTHCGGAIDGVSFPRIGMSFPPIEGGEGKLRVGIRQRGRGKFGGLWKLEAETPVRLHNTGGRDSPRPTRAERPISSKKQQQAPHDLERPGKRSAH
nr:unnamed protein product [Digitaria exilis]